VWTTRLNHSRRSDETRALLQRGRLRAISILAHRREALRSRLLLRELGSAPNLDEGRYYFSAFLSAARSVTYALQKCLRGLADFDAWYRDRQAKLKAHPSARYFHTMRNEMIHEGLNPLHSHVRGVGGINGANFYLRDDAPERDAMRACTSYMAILVRVTGDAYQRYWMSLDLPSTLTAGELEVRGQSIEDIEEEFGYPRGWSASLPFDERLAWMKEFSKTEIARLRQRYL
jgi:hypothetical protein